MTKTLPKFKPHDIVQLSIHHRGEMKTLVGVVQYAVKARKSSHWLYAIEGWMSEHQEKELTRL